MVIFFIILNISYVLAQQKCHPLLVTRQGVWLNVCRTNNGKGRAFFCTDECLAGSTDTTPCQSNDNSCNTGIDCWTQPLTAKTLTTDKFSYLMNSGIKTPFTGYLDLFNNPYQSNCPLWDCQTLIVSTQDANGACTDAATCGGSIAPDTGIASFTTSLIQSTTYKASCRNELYDALQLEVGQYTESNPFTITICPPTCEQSMIEPSGLVATTTYVIDGTIPHLLVNKFSHNYPALCTVLSCVPTATEIFTSQSDLSTPAGMDSTLSDTGSQWKISVLSANTNTEGSYNFELRGTYSGPFYKWASIGTMTLNVVCGPLSTTVSLGSYPAGYGDIQNVDVNDNDASKLTRFVIQSFTLSQPGCALTTYELVSATTGIHIEKIGNDWFAVPDNKNSHEIYYFNVKVIARGGATITTSNQLTLNVGCSTAVITSNIGFTNSATVMINAPTSGVYSYAQPTVTPAYCAVTNNALLSVTPSSAALFDSACSQPCTSVDLASTATVMDITIQIQSTIPGGRTHNSNIITISIICQANAVTISHTLTIFTQQIPLNAASPNDRYTFSQFTCNPAACCVGDKALVYKISSSNTLPTSGATVFTANGFNSVVGTQGSDQYVELSTTSSINTYSFYIYAKNGWGTEIFTPQVSISVVCLPSSTTISQGSYPATKTSTQLVQANDNDASALTQFMLPNFISSESDCPIVSYRLVQTQQDSAPQWTSFQIPSSTVAVPSNISLHEEYSFWLIVEAQGGAKFISNDMKLIVGCTPSMTYTESSSLVITKELDIGSSPFSVFSYILPIPNRSFCQATQTFIIESKVNGEASASAARLNTSSCAGQVCLNVDADNTDLLFPLTFRIKTQFGYRADVFNLSPVITINFKCNAATNIMISTLTISDVSYQMNDPNPLLYFAPFTCTYTACCQIITYKLTTNNNLTEPVYHPMLSSVTTSTNQSLVSTVNTSQVRTSIFYILATNELGNQIYSHAVNIKVFFNCSLDTFSLNQTQPVQNKENYLKTPQGYVFTVNQQIGILTYMSVNITNRVSKLSPAGSCNITDYRIKSVFNGPTPVQKTEFQSLFEVESTGLFKLKRFDLEYSYKIFIEVFNGQIWGAISSPIADITFTKPEEKPTPNIPPFFEYELNPQQFTTEQAMVEYKLPKVIDGNNGDVSTVSVTGLQSFMRYDIENHKLYLDMTQVKQNQTYTLTFTLKDNRGATNQVNFRIDVIKKYEPPPPTPPPVFIFNQTKEKENNRNQNFQFKAPLEARIRSISAIGEVVIEFSYEMKMDVNLSWFNKSTIEMYVQPTDSRHIDQPNFNLSLLNFTFHATSMTQTTLVFQLDFTSPMSISPNIRQDYLVIYFKNRDLLQATNEEILAEEFQECRSRIRKQNPSSTLTQSVATSVESSEALMRGMLIFSFCMNIFLSGSMQYMMGMLRSLQIILHLPMLAIVIPGNVGLMFTTMVPLVMFDLLDSEYTTEQVLNFDYEQHELNQKLMNPQMFELSYESYNQLLNLGSVVLFIGFWIFKVMIYYVLRKTKKYPKIMKNLADSIFYGSIISIWLEAYLEFVITGILQVQKPLFTTLGEVLSTCTAYFSLFMAFLVPGLFAWMICNKPLCHIHTINFERRFGAFYESVKTSNKHSLSFFLWFMLRRIFFVALIFGVPSSSCQLIGLQFANLMITIYNLNYKPFELKVKNQLEIFNEVCIFYSVLHMNFFTDWIHDTQMQYKLGWSLIVLVVFCILFNLAFIFYFGFHSISLLYQKYKKRYDQWNEKRKPQIKYISEPVIENLDSSSRSSVNNTDKDNEQQKYSSDEDVDIAGVYQSFETPTNMNVLKVQDNLNFHLSVIHEQDEKGSYPDLDIHDINGRSFNRDSPIIEKIPDGLDEIEEQHTELMTKIHNSLKHARSYQSVKIPKKKEPKKSVPAYLKVYQQKLSLFQVKPIQAPTTPTPASYQRKAWDPRVYDKRLIPLDKL